MALRARFDVGSVSGGRGTGRPGGIRQDALLLRRTRGANWVLAGRRERRDAELDHESERLLSESGTHGPADEPDDSGGKYGMALFLPHPRTREAPVAQQPQAEVGEA